MRCEAGFIAALTAGVIGLFPIIAHAEPASMLHGSCRTHYPSDAAIEWECRTLHSGETLEQLFGEDWINVALFNRIDRRHAHAGVSIKVPKHLEDLEPFVPLPLLYLAAEQEKRFILVDLSEQLLGAYEYGVLRFVLPITSGNGYEPTPTGEFRLSAAHRHHQSNLFTIEGTDRPYPMNYGLRFYINREGVSYWIHGRDLPGYPASHGCIGLYDEPMQEKQYGFPKDPRLNDAKRLFDWVLSDQVQGNQLIPLYHGPRVHIIGQAPKH